MNQKLQDHIKEVVEYTKYQLENILLCATKATTAGHVLSRLPNELAESVQISAYGGSVWLDVFNRDDLQTVMTLAPIWTKITEGDVISYRATIEDVPFKLCAHEAALPDTCKLVEEDVVIPAQPERVEKRMVVKCAQPVSETASVPDLKVGESDF